MSDARAALKARQGPGARYDAPEAPQEALLAARRATAALARVVGGLRDADLVGDVAAEVARIGYHARALTRLLDGQPMWGSDAAREAETALGATLPPHALRALFQHTNVHLDTCWRDLPGPDWDRTGVRLDGTRVTFRDTPQIRARALRDCALALGARPADLPGDLRALSAAQ